MGKSDAIASYIELRFLKDQWLFKVKFTDGNCTEGHLFPVRTIKTPNCFPRKTWWFIEIKEPYNSKGVLSKKISVEEIEEIDNIR